VAARDGGSPTVPVWPNIIDVAMVEAIELLGGDPDL
jgi:hypothetical protein